MSGEREKERGSKMYLEGVKYIFYNIKATKEIHFFSCVVDCISHNAFVFNTTGEKWRCTGGS